MKYDQQSTFTFIHNTDCYEVRLHGCTIAGITRYVNSSSFRQEVEYADLCVEAQDRILDKVHQILLEQT